MNVSEKIDLDLTTITLIEDQMYNTIFDKYQSVPQKN